MRFRRRARPGSDETVRPPNPAPTYLGAVEVRDARRGELLTLARDLGARRERAERGAPRVEHALELACREGARCRVRMAGV